MEIGALQSFDNIHLISTWQFDGFDKYQVCSDQSRVGQGLRLKN
jgi:hypothetical protein